MNDFDMDLSSREPYLSLRRRLTAGALSHAYLISGASERERRQLTQWIASACVCTAKEDIPCGLCSACHKAQQGIHPDIITIEGETGKSITVAQARDARADAFILPNEARRKVYCFPHADFMSQSAQNALLKVLEDGPAYATFIIIAENKERLLPTIRSRCESFLLSEEDKDFISPEFASGAEYLADNLQNGTPLTLLEAVVPIEKMSREDFDVLITDTITILTNRMEQNPHQIIPLIERLHKISDANRFHVGIGHLTGLLLVK